MHSYKMAGYQLYKCLSKHQWNKLGIEWFGLGVHLLIRQEILHDSTNTALKMWKYISYSNWTYWKHSQFWNKALVKLEWDAQKTVLPWVKGHIDFRTF